MDKTKQGLVVPVEENFTVSYVIKSRNYDLEVPNQDISHSGKPKT